MMEEEKDGDDKTKGAGPDVEGPSRDDARKEKEEPVLAPQRKARGHLDSSSEPALTGSRSSDRSKVHWQTQGCISDLKDFAIYVENLMIARGARWYPRL